MLAMVDISNIGLKLMACSVNHYETRGNQHNLGFVKQAEATAAS